MHCPHAGCSGAAAAGGQASCAPGAAAACNARRLPGFVASTLPALKASVAASINACGCSRLLHSATRRICRLRPAAAAAACCSRCLRRCSPSLLTVAYCRWEDACAAAPRAGESAGGHEQVRQLEEAPGEDLRVWMGAGWTAESDANKVLTRGGLQAALGCPKCALSMARLLRGDKR